MAYCGFHTLGQHNQGRANPEPDPSCPLCNDPHDDAPPTTTPTTPTTPHQGGPSNPFRWWFFSVHQIPVWRAIVSNIVVLSLVGIYGFQVITEGVVPSGFELILGVVLGFFLARTR